MSVEHQLNSFPFAFWPIQQIKKAARIITTSHQYIHLYTEPPFRTADIINLWFNNPKYLEFFKIIYVLYNCKHFTW